MQNSKGIWWITLDVDLSELYARNLDFKTYVEILREA